MLHYYMRAKLYNIKYTEMFEKWMQTIKDSKLKANINIRIKRIAFGNFGDVKPVGDGVSELRIHTGAGYRIYFCQCGKMTIFLLCGGDKDSQAKDIEKAKEMKKCLIKQLLN